MSSGDDNRRLDGETEGDRSGSEGSDLILAGVTDNDDSHATEEIGYETNDPKPPRAGATTAEKRDYVKSLTAYTQEWIGIQESARFVDGELLWTDYINDFSPSSLRFLEKKERTDLRNILLKYGIQIPKGRGVYVTKALIDCWSKEACPLGSIKEQRGDEAEESGVALTQREAAPELGADIINTTIDAADIAVTAAEYTKSATQGTLLPKDAREAAERMVHDVTLEQDLQRGGSRRVYPSLSRDQKVRFDGDIARTKLPTSVTVPKDMAVENRSHVDDRSRKQNLSNIAKALAGRPRYTGGYDEDFIGIVEVYEMTTGMYELSQQEMLKGIPSILEGSALTYFASHVQGKVSSYHEAIERLKDWFTSQEQRNRLLSEWQETKLSTWCRKHSDKSQMEVFRMMFDRLSRIQRQLHYDYRRDMFFRDQLVASVSDLKPIYDALRQQFPETSLKAKERIGALLSGELGSANQITSNDADAYYGLGQRYGGSAQRKFRRRAVKPEYKGHHRDPQRRKLARVKGCWVCGSNDHMARDKHSREDIQKALNKHTNNKSYLAASDVYATFFAEYSESSTSESETDSDHNSDVANIAMLEDEVVEVNKVIEQNLANETFLHSCGFFADRKDDMDKMNRALKVTQRDTEWNGLVIDTGANRVSTISLKQYQAYCREFNVPAKIIKSEKRVGGFASSSKAIGCAVIAIPFPEFGFTADITFHIFDEACPTLLCNRDMLRIGIDEISLRKAHITCQGRILKLDYINDLLVYHWSSTIVLFTYDELQKLHRSFGHPTVSALYKVLKRARPDEATPEVLQAIEELVKRCKICVEQGQKPRRFKISIGSEDTCFNSIVAIDIMHLDHKPALHVVDEATHYNAASFLKNNSSKEVWNAFLFCWVHTYMGPPDFLKVDQGSNLVSKEFKGNASASGIQLVEEPVENPASMSHVERYHAPLRAAYEKLKQAMPKDTPARRLQTAVHCVNSTMGPEGLCPNLCVFGAIPRPLRTAPAPDQVERARAIDKAMDAVAKEQAKRRVTFAKSYRGPYGKERSDLDNLPCGAPVRVWRPDSGVNNKRGRWEGPFKFINKEGETVCVQMPHGRQIFRSHVVKPDHSVEYENNESNVANLCYWVQAPTECDVDTETASKSNYSKEETSNSKNSESHSDAAPLDSDRDIEPVPKISEPVAEHMFGDAYVVQMKPNDKHTFKGARSKELKGLQEREVFKIVDADTVPNGTRIYDAGWVDVLKTSDSGELIEKSRLVARNYRDTHAKHIPTKSPTISRMGQRMTLCIAAMHKKGRVYSRDITQAYTQSSTKLERLVYLRPPPEMNLPEGKLLLLIKPLYGVPESGLHWFVTYSEHHKNRLGMKQCRADKCLFYRNESSNGIPSILALQVDDSFGAGSDKFLEEEEAAATIFKTKPRKVMSKGNTIIFNGALISLQNNNTLSMSQEDKIKDISKIKNSDEAISARAKLQYIATSTRPDLSSAVQILASDVDNASESTIKKLNKLIDHSKGTAQRQLRFVQLDPDSLKVILFTDASFANVNKYSQLGFIICLQDRTGKTNTIHYASRRCRRVTRSVMAAELLALVTGFDHAFVARHTLEEMLQRKIPIEAYVDSRTTFNCVAKSADTLEKRLQIDAAALRESHYKGELNRLGWIPGSQNPADGLTKGSLLPPTHPLVQLLENNRIHITPEGWADKVCEDRGSSQKEKP